MATQIDVLNAEILNAQAKKAANTADVNLRNELLDKNITDWTAQITALQSQSQS